MRRRRLLIAIVIAVALIGAGAGYLQGRDLGSSGPVPCGCVDPTLFAH